LVLSIAHRFVLGTPLSVLADEVDTVGRLAERYGARDRVGGSAAALAGMLARLAGEPGEATDAADLPPVARAVTVITAGLLGDHARARSVAPGADDGSFLSAVTACYHALAVAAEYPDADAARREAILAELSGRQAV